MKGNRFYILFYTLLFFVSCNSYRDDPKPIPPSTPQPTPCDTCLPAITTIGANTFGCKINGKLWLPKGGWSTPEVRFDLLGNSLGIIAENYDLKEHIGFYFNPIYDTCYHIFPTHTLSTARSFYSNYNPNDYRDFYADTILKGYIHFMRVDFINGIFSGTFEFDAYDIYHKNNDDTIHVTEGRFDVRP